MEIKKAFGIKDAERIMTKGLSVQPALTGWTQSVSGTGATGMTPFYSNITSGATAGSTALLYALLRGFNVGGSFAALNFDKLLVIDFSTAIAVNAGYISYFQSKVATSHGDLDAKGFGIKVSNATIYGESFGTERGEIELGTIANNTNFKVTIILYPAQKIEWYINGVLVGSQSTAAKIPTGTTAGNALLMISTGNGEIASAASMFLSSLRLLQEV